MAPGRYCIYIYIYLAYFMKTCTVTDSGIRVERLSQTAFPPGTAIYFIGGGPSPRPDPNSPKAWLGTHVCLGCERLNPGRGGWVEFATKRTLIAPIFFLA